MEPGWARTAQTGWPVQIGGVVCHCAPCRAAMRLASVSPRPNPEGLQVESARPHARAHAGVADADAAALRIGCTLTWMWVPGGLCWIALSSRLRRASASRMGRPATATVEWGPWSPGPSPGRVRGRPGRGGPQPGGPGDSGTLAPPPALPGAVRGQSQQLGQYFACMQCLRLHGVQGLGPLYRVGAGSGHMALQGQ